MASSMTQVDVVNRALTKLGATKIANLEDDNKNARVMLDLADPVRDSFLRCNPWNPAVTRVTIAKDTTAPAYQYSARFSLPSDFLKMLNVETSSRVFAIGIGAQRTPPQNIDYRIESGFILANEDTSLNVRYVKRLEDMSQYTSDMIEALATFYAVEACYAITGDRALKEDLVVEYRAQIKMAKRNDGWDDDMYTFPTDPWVTVRA